MSEYRSADEGEPPPDAEPELTPEEGLEVELAQQRLARERSYFIVSRSLSASLIFVIPLLVIYELGILSDINAAALWVKTPISWLRAHPAQLLGANITLILNAIGILAVFMAVRRLGRLGALHLGTFYGMFAESCVYALLIGPIALLPLVGRWEFPGFSPNLSNFWAKIVMSCGAGVYEEFLFRFLLLGIIFFLAQELGKLGRFSAGALALFISGAVFSAAHFLGPGENPAYSAFIYRLVAGMVFGVIYLARGFGIAAFTHALYDVYVLCFIADQ